MTPKPKYDPDDDIISLAASCQYNPNAWARLAWDWGHGELADYAGPRTWQVDINKIIADHLANPETRFQPLKIAVASGHGIGKSAEIGMVSNWAMSCFASCKMVITAMTDTQLWTKTQPEVAKWFNLAITAHWFDVNATSIKIKAGNSAEAWQCDFVTWSINNTESFQGLHNKGKIIVVIMDEASGIHDKIAEVTQGALTDENTIIIWLCFGNPTRNAGFFRECFRRFRHRWITRNINSLDVEGTNKIEIQKEIDDHGWDSDRVKIRVRGEFPSMAANQFISTDDVDAARGRHLRPEQYNFAPKIIGVDPAWTGDDEFVIYFRQGLYSKLLAKFAKNDNDIAMAQHILRFEQELNADAVFIDAGHGTGIYSAGKTWGRAWQLVWFAESSADIGCLNKRVEMWKNMRDWLKQGGAIDDKDDVLYQDLIGPELVPRLDGKLQLESKEDMKDRLIPSPNRADALALTFAHPVVAKLADSGPDGHHVSGENYNPYQ